MKAIIAAAQLESVNACDDQVELFRKTFGESAVVTVAKARKVAELFDWGFAARLLDSEGAAEYQRVKGPARAEYKRVQGEAWAEYQRVIGEAWAEYQRVKGPARAEYERVELPAWAEYERAQSEAWAEYKRVEGEAWASAYIATCKRRAA